MFFSKDLLSMKGSPFSRIWLLGCNVEKLKNADYKTKMAPLIKAIHDWILREDGRRISLYLSSALTYGLIRVVCGQVRILKRDVKKAKLELARQLRMAQTLTEEPIDVDQVPNIDIDLTEPEDSTGSLGRMFDETLANNGSLHLMRDVDRFQEEATEEDEEQHGEDDGFGEDPR